MLRRIDDASLQEILNMESYRSHQFFVEAGEPIKKTQNCFSWAGAVTLANTCSASLERDYARSVTRRTLIKNSLLELLNEYNRTSSLNYDTHCLNFIIFYNQSGGAGKNHII